LKYIKQLFIGALTLWLTLIIFSPGINGFVYGFTGKEISELSENYQFFFKHLLSSILIIVLFFIYKFQKISWPFKPIYSKAFIIATFFTIFLESIIEITIHSVFSTEGFLKLNPYFNYSLLPFYLVAIFISALLEEIIFRHYLFSRLQNLFNKKHDIIAVVVSAIIFSVAHFTNRDAMLVLSIFVSGLLYGFLFIKYNSIWIPLGVHFGHNLFSIAMTGDIISLTTEDNFIYGQEPILTIVRAIIIYFALIKLCPTTGISNSFNPSPKRI
jgi:membrane protease YdiL (CAAX protease family)